MRLWSLHPRYLDAKGLVAVWREGLLALHVLQGKTQGYKHHPQLTRFQEQSKPVQAITNYLHGIVDEADQRDYHFDRTKLQSYRPLPAIHVSRRQVDYELNHLKRKLRKRAITQYKLVVAITHAQAHPSFKITAGPIAAWEHINK